MKTEKKPKEKKKPNQLEKLVLNIDSPLKMNQEIEFAKLALFAGANSSGKSFMLKVAYALGTIGMMRIAPPGPTSAAQFVMDNTFTDQKFNGSLKAVYTHGSVYVELKEGRVEKSEVAGETMPVTFMSTELRTFEQMALYLRLRKTASNDPVEFIKKMLEAYRLYDYTYMESLLSRMPMLLPEGVREHVMAMDFPDPIVSVEADTDRCEFRAVLKNGEKKNISTYGHGHQAILNMAIGVTQ